jgi:hypothetical protein
MYILRDVALHGVGLHWYPRDDDPAHAQSLVSEDIVNAWLRGRSRHALLSPEAAAMAA